MEKGVPIPKSLDPKAKGKYPRKSMKDVQNLARDIRECRELADEFEKDATRETEFDAPLIRGILFTSETRCTLSSAGYFSRMYDTGVAIKVRFKTKQATALFVKLLCRRGWDAEVIISPFE